MTENRDRPEWLVPIFSYLEASSKQPQTGLALLNRSRSSIPVGPRHGDPFHSFLSGITAWRSGLLSALWHGDPAHRCLSGILACQSVLLTGPRHGDPFHRYLSGITAWRRGLLSTLRHGNPAHRYFRSIPAWRPADRSMTSHLPITYRCSDRSSAGLSNR